MPGPARESKNVGFSQIPKRRRWFSGYRSPLTASGASTLSSASSISAEILSDTAAAFSLSRWRWLVPGIGTTKGARDKTQADLRSLGPPSTLQARRAVEEDGFRAKPADDTWTAPGTRT